MRRTLLLLGSMALVGVLSVALLLAQSARPVHAAHTNCSTTSSTTTCTFDTVGTSTWTVPDGVTEATFDLFGAQGGAGYNDGAGGLGGEATATIPVTPGEPLQVNVGGQGGTPNCCDGGAGGFNGGGGGGGASDVRSDAFALAERIIVAGGGGGRGGIRGGAGGGGGGTSGESGCCSPDSNPVGIGGPGGGGTQLAGGSGTIYMDGDPGSTGALGTGGAGGNARDTRNHAGGGGGGGGSGFGPNGVVFDSGARSGNGLVTITYATPQDTTAPTVTNGSPTGAASKTATVTATFSEDVQNVDTTTFKLERAIAVKKSPTKYEPVAATVAPSNGIVEHDANATLTQTLDLPQGTYRVTLTNGVTDTAGNALVPYTWTFMVRK